jgi:hypothetical protein
MVVRKPNRGGKLRTNYMTRKHLRQGNPYRTRGLKFREVACWYCLPGRPKKYIQAVEEKW